MPDGFVKMYVDEDRRKPYYLVRTGPPVITAGQISAAYATTDARGMPAIGIDLKPGGVERLAETTGKCTNCSLAIVVDGKLRSAPRVEGSVTGKLIIHGHFGAPEVNVLVERLQFALSHKESPPFP